MKEKRKKNIYLKKKIHFLTILTAREARCGDTFVILAVRRLKMSELWALSHPGLRTGYWASTATQQDPVSTNQTKPNQHTPPKQRMRGPGSWTTLYTASKPRPTGLTSPPSPQSQGEGKSASSGKQLWPGREGREEGAKGSPGNSMAESQGSAPALEPTPQPPHPPSTGHGGNWPPSTT